MHNPTVDVLLDRRSIRAFQQESIDPQILTTIEAAAQHAASSQYLNDWSAIRILDHTLKQQKAPTAVYRRRRRTVCVCA